MYRRKEKTEKYPRLVRVDEKEYSWILQAGTEFLSSGSYQGCNYLNLLNKIGFIKYIFETKILNKHGNLKKVLTSHQTISTSEFNLKIRLLMKSRHLLRIFKSIKRQIKFYEQRKKRLTVCKFPCLFAYYNIYN